eukprot:COSAG01_NODE_47822_length_386_cov_2.557491_1_plen_61_part_10
MIPMVSCCQVVEQDEPITFVLGFPSLLLFKYIFLHYFCHFCLIMGHFWVSGWPPSATSLYH